MTAVTHAWPRLPHWALDQRWGCRDLALPLALGPALRVCYPAAAPRPSSSETRDCMRAWLVRSAAGLYVGATYPQTPRLQEAESPPTCTRGWRGLELNGGRVPHALSAVCHSEAQQSRPNTLPSSPLPPRDFRRPAPGPAPAVSGRPILAVAHSGPPIPPPPRIAHGIGSSPSATATPLPAALPFTVPLDPSSLGPPTAFLWEDPRCECGGKVGMTPP